MGLQRGRRALAPLEARPALHAHGARTGQHMDAGSFARERGRSMQLTFDRVTKDAGELLQYGQTAEGSQSLRVARAFSDPPMNLMTGVAAGGVQIEGGPLLPVALPAGVDGV